MAVVYIHKKKTDGSIFYVGIGSRKQRAYSKHGRNPIWKSIVSKHGYDVIIIADDISIDEAKYYERYLIRYHGRKNCNNGILCNLTDGGDGVHGYVFTEERRILAGNINRGKKFSEEHKLKISKSQTGKKHSDKTKLKMRLAKVGYVPYNKGKKTGKSAHNAKTVLLFNTDGSIEKEFMNTYDAGNYIGFSQSIVFKNCKHLTKMRDGRYFRYKQP